MLAKSAYNLGVDAIIVQDLGLAKYLITNFPNLPIHASTQMTVHNLEGAVFAEKFGFKRVVLSRELSIEEIRFIKENSNIEIETFVHGALCISYSGQCLFSSMIGGRSGNRGKCAQSCRLPYELYENDSKIDKGYLLSTRDLCALDYLPQLIDYGIDCFKIEGRMKSPEYVATVTRIYRKYIDLYLKNPSEYKIDIQDKKDLLQVFNRGEFSSGHYNIHANKDLVYPEKQNNMGIYVGNVSNYNPSKGYITLNLNDNLAIGDTISFEHENSKYTISELMINNENVSSASPKNIVKIGRMKGNIFCGDKIYKLSSKTLSKKALDSYSNNENIKIELVGNIKIHKNFPIELNVSLKDKNLFNADIYTKITSTVYPENALNSPITKDRIKKQLSKTNNTPFVFSDIEIDLEDNVILSISALNELRRQAISDIENKIINSFKKDRNSNLTIGNLKKDNICSRINKNKTISLLLNQLSFDFDYTKLENVNRIYIPLKYFSMLNYKKILTYFTTHYDTYIYMPTIIKTNYRNILKNSIDKAIETFNIKGFVISNVGNIELLKEYFSEFDIISNYTFNVFNNNTINELTNLGINTITISPELNYDELTNLIKNINIDTELIVYGNLPVMTTKYCFLGKTNKCYPECTSKCKNRSNFYLKDRLGFKFKVLPDSQSTVSTIYNSKTTSICASNFNVSSARIDILDENIDEINKIILAVKSGTVVKSLALRYPNGSYRSYGEYVVIDHHDGTMTLYAHMSSRAVSTNQTVSQGQQIGSVGSTGNSTGPHLHFEVLIGGDPTNPVPYLP